MREAIRTLALLALAGAASSFAGAAGFTDIGAGLAGVDHCSLAWGDYDGDGDLDLVVAGFTTGGSITKLYKNNGGSFAEVAAGLPGVGLNGGALAWGDFDNDGDLDLAIAGQAVGGYICSIYRNTGGTFTDINAQMAGVRGCSLAWGDYDNDGDLDLAVLGCEGYWDNVYHYVCRIHRNDGGAFPDIGAGLTGASGGQVAWGDYDNDGDLDLAMSGWTGSGVVSKVYRNNNGGFTDINAGLVGISGSGAMAWGDYDNDGDLDLLIAGNADVEFVTILYRNNAGTFADAGANLPGLQTCSAAWGDYDNDGDLDLAMAGDTGSGRTARVYRNDGGVFTEITAGLTGVWTCGLAWGDYDGDGDLDLALGGEISGGRVVKVYRSDGFAPDTPPAAPSGLASAVAGPNVTFTWKAATDSQTPSAGLGYNLRVGTRPGADDVSCGMAASSGLRRLPALGNAQKRLSWTLKGLASTTGLYWSVQAIDTAFAGSAWAAEQTIGQTLRPPLVKTSPGPMPYVENEDPIVVDPYVAVTDEDSPDLAGATVQITGNYVPGQDVLTFASPGGIVGSFDPLTGRLSLAGTASVGMYQLVLRSVIYFNTSDNPSPLDRTITFRASDATATSDPATKTVKVIPLNDPPVVTTSSWQLLYLPGAGAMAVDPNIVVIDEDSPTLTRATVQILSNYVGGQDVLGFTDQSGIEGSFDAASARLILTGEASVAAYQAALRSITYTNKSVNPIVADRAVTFAVSDGEAWSNVPTKMIRVRVQWVGDVNGDGCVNVIDLLIVRNNIGKGSCR